MTLPFYLTPEVILVVWATILLIVEAFFEPESRRIGQASILGYVVALGLLIWRWNVGPLEYWSQGYIIDGKAMVFKLFFVITGGIVAWMGLQYEKQIENAKSEFHLFLMYATAGLSLLASAQDFILLFVGLEFVTITFYMLVAFHRNRAESLEAGVKYLILGALASAFLIMGIAYIFGTTGSIKFDLVVKHLSSYDANVGIIFGLMLILIGLGFKIAAAPFHVWAPDVYQGAPLPVTSFLAIGSKAAGFILLLRVFNGVLSKTSLAAHWVPTMIGLAIFSMILGNLAAIPQRNLKRMMAYSGIGHAGFLLAGIAANSAAAQTAVTTYLFAYLISSTAIFLVMSRLPELEDSIPSYAGLGRRSPFLAFVMSAGLISLAGIPPLIGFTGKLGIFVVAWQSGFYLLFAVGVISAIAGLYYYLSIVRTLYWHEPADPTPVTCGWADQVVIGAFGILILVLGFWPQSLISLAALVSPAPPCP